ncbi:hypothetical protein [Stenotrophomonas lactitubi]|uniref:hypothetical protein n=1 Tax=Stenotrophomonas lactitubi TaxID=2045214 RepID=UPI00320A95AF
MLSRMNGRKVVLETFLGNRHPHENVRPSENYWKLIGTTGTVVSEESQTSMPAHPRGARVLVQFPAGIRNLGLACHNEAPDSLWLFVSDLVIRPAD